MWVPHKSPEVSNPTHLQYIDGAVLLASSGDPYARDALPRYAGKKVSATKVSRVVGVVVAGERDSSIFIWPEFWAAAISSNRSAMLDDIPICISMGFSCSARTSVYARSGLPIATPTIFATSA